MVHRWAGVWLVAGAWLVAGCGGGTTPRRPPDAGTRTPPSGAMVATLATYPPNSSSMQGTPSMQTAPGACSATAVGRCGCLDPANWYVAPDGTIYDVVCCTAVGDNYVLYTCGATTICDDDKGRTVCE